MSFVCNRGGRALVFAALVVGCAHASPVPGAGNAELIAGAPHTAGAATVTPTPPGEAVVETSSAIGDGGPAQAARLDEPFAVERAPSGDLYVAEMGGNRVRRIDAGGLITTVVGTGSKGDAGDGGPGPRALLNGPHHVAWPAGADRLFIADTFNHRVRTYDPKSGVVSAAFGVGDKSFGGDGGPASAAHFGSMFCLGFTHDGRAVYLADLDNRRIRRIDLTTGLVSTVAGNGTTGVPPDGALAVQAPLVDPRAVAVDSRGNVYVVERNGHALRVIDTAGHIRTVAGTGQKGGDGDGGDARAARLNGRKFLTIDRDDSVLIVDTENHAIRRYSPIDGKITRVAGTGRAGSGGIGGPALALELSRPHGVLVDRDGALIIADSENHRLVRLPR